jgi:beta-glucosidase
MKKKLPLLGVLMVAAGMAACSMQPVTQRSAARTVDTVTSGGAAGEDQANAVNTAHVRGASAATVAAAESQREAFIDRLMQRMTQDEKIGQLRLLSVEAGPNPDRSGFLHEIELGHAGAIFNTVTRQDIRVLQEASQRSRLKIPLFFAYDVVHGHRTVFPISLGLAASWDMDAIGRSARVSAIEASADGLNMTFSPMIDITRDPRWGRVSEGWGEDTYLTSRIAAVMVKGYQGDDPSAPGTVMSTFKHFALYGAPEGGRDYNTVDMSPQRMYQDYLPPYKAAVDAGARGVMISLNSINGVPATANKWLLQDVLRKQWGFKGITISDHGAIMELMRHGVAKDGRDAARLAITAGADMSMKDELLGPNLASLIQSGQVPQADLDRAVRDVLRVKYDLGLFADPYRHLGKSDEDPVDTNAEARLHRADARDVARRTLVLLKNDNNALPLRKQGTIAVIGPLAKSQRDVMGSWSAAGLARQSVSVFQGLQNAVGDHARLVYAKGANVIDDPAIVKYLNEYEQDVDVDTRTPQQMIDEAVRVARRSDVVLAVVGESQGMAHEASSRTDITIPESQGKLLQALADALKGTGKPLVLVLMNGRPLALPWEYEHADAMLETWFAGTEGGNAIADVLFGDYNPSGKITMTFPRSVGQIPIYYNHLNTGRPFDPEHPDKYTSRYFDSPSDPLFPFGYGLSYTSFAVSDVRMSSTTLAQDGSIDASVTVSNTGSRDGETVVQMYLRDPVATISRPVEELKNFQKIMLKAGESKEVRFTLRKSDLLYYDNDLKQIAEPGEYDVMIGLDSRAVKQGRFTLSGS